MSNDEYKITICISNHDGTEDEKVYPFTGDLESAKNQVTQRVAAAYSSDRVAGVSGSLEDSLGNSM